MFPHLQQRPVANAGITQQPLCPLWFLTAERGMKHRTEQIHSFSEGQLNLPGLINRRQSLLLFLRNPWLCRCMQPQDLLGLRICISFHSSTSPWSLSELLNARVKQDRHRGGIMLFCLSGKIFLQVYGGVLLFSIEGKSKIGPTPESDGLGLKFQCERNTALNCNECWK